MRLTTTKSYSLIGGCSDLVRSLETNDLQRLILGNPICRQYSSGNKTVVADRSCSVMTHSLAFSLVW